MSAGTSPASTGSSRSPAAISCRRPREAGMGKTLIEMVIHDDTEPRRLRTSTGAGAYASRFDSEIYGSIEMALVGNLAPSRGWPRRTLTRVADRGRQEGTAWHGLTNSRRDREGPRTSRQCLSRCRLDLLGEGQAETTVLVRAIIDAGRRLEARWRGSASTRNWARVCSGNMAPSIREWSSRRTIVSRTGSRSIVSRLTERRWATLLRGPHIKPLERMQIAPILDGSQLAPVALCSGERGLLHE